MTALPDLAIAIEIEHRAAGAAARTALEHAIRCGELLIQAKAAVGHSAWLPWLEANCTLRLPTAQAYMRLARELPKLPAAEEQRVADLTSPANTRSAAGLGTGQGAPRRPGAAAGQNQRIGSSGW